MVCESSDFLHLQLTDIFGSSVFDIVATIWNFFKPGVIKVSRNIRFVTGHIIGWNLGQKFKCLFQ